MTAPCDTMTLLMQAELDGELSIAETASLAAHLAQCESCRQAQAQMMDLSARLRADIPRATASTALRRAVRQKIDAALPPEKPRANPRALFGAGFALAACLALVMFQARTSGTGEEQGLAQAVVSAHIRALQPGHLMDVVSTDQHTVKPWFDGRLPFAPPVHDLAAAGFPLIGGRLDFIAGHTAAALIYRRDKHIIDVLVWPETGAPPAPPRAVNGYNIVTWRNSGMAFWAVSDLNARELGELADKLQTP